ncbi:unnamed protein product [Toxocara canis]|uniref:Kinesin-like protein n=1 Tax=Toxocara canis TaxID=6265 RepID=A0A183VBR0_TOXCA|nr:unnamed protein product [Toxocara canis]
MRSFYALFAYPSTGNIASKLFAEDKKAFGQWEPALPPLVADVASKLKASDAGWMTRGALDALTGACAAPNWTGAAIVLVTVTPMLTPLKFVNDQCHDEHADWSGQLGQPRRSMWDNVEVALRVRPFDEHESRQEALLIEGNNVEVLTASKKCSFKFAHIFGPESSQEDVYKKFALPLLAHVMSGINACIFAYGQTGSGKTYSIVGNHDNPGLLQRFGKDFFDAASEVKPEERQVAVSFYEIYQEKAYDLLGDGRQALRVRGAEETYLGGLTEAVVRSFNDFENLRQRAWAKRATASTALNRHSSRSHAIVRLVYQRTVIENAGEETRPFGITSHIYFVDLAGSERLVPSGYSRIEKLKSDKRCRPCGFRDSILTRLLKECLVGNARTALLANVSPSTDLVGETLSTLRFATKAASVSLTPRVNLDPFLELVIVNNLRSENEELKERLTEAEALVPTAFIRPEAPSVIELQRDPALTTWTLLTKELVFSPCGFGWLLYEVVVRFELGSDGGGAKVESCGEGVYLNGELLARGNKQVIKNADRVVVRDERYATICLKDSS